MKVKPLKFTVYSDEKYASSPGKGFRYEIHRAENQWYWMHWQSGDGWNKSHSLAEAKEEINKYHEALVMSMIEEEK